MLHQFVASGFIVTPDRSKALLIWHNKLAKWVQPGGHLDQDELPHEGALREVAEEVGLSPRIIPFGVDLKMPAQNPVERQAPTPYAIFREVIPANHKDSEHIHIDLMYIMEHEEVQPAVCSERELSKVAWFTAAQINELDTFQSVRAMAKDLLKE